MIDILEDFMNLRKYTFFRLDGASNIADRRDMVNDFQKPNSKIFVFLLSTRAGILLIIQVDWVLHLQLLILLYFMIMIGILLWMHRLLIEHIGLVRIGMLMCISLSLRVPLRRGLLREPNRKRRCKALFMKEHHPSTFSRGISLILWLMNSMLMSMNGSRRSLKTRRSLARDRRRRVTIKRQSKHKNTLRWFHPRQTANIINDTLQIDVWIFYKPAPNPSLSSPSPLLLPMANCPTTYC